MTRTFVAGLIILAMVWLLVYAYEQLPQLQGWVVFGTIAGLAMSRKPCRAKSAGSSAP